jgi:hypothetical protein
MKQKKIFDLQQFQVNFSNLILTPLIENKGHLIPDIAKFPEYMNDVTNQNHLTSVGLRTYNQNYWYKILNTLQTILPLFSNLVGLWEFNQLSLRYFGHFKYSSRDLGDIPERFFSDVKLEIAKSNRVDLRALLLQALAIDLAWHQLFKNQAITAAKVFKAPGERSIFRLREHFCILQDSFDLWSKRFDLLALRERQGSSSQNMIDSWKVQERLSDEFYILKSLELTVEKISISRLEALFLNSLNQHSLQEGILKFSQALTASDLQIAEASLHHWIKLSLERDMWQIDEVIHK